MDEQDKKALDNIEEFGCHVLGVMEGDGEPCFSYSIGINKKQEKPDLVILGLKSELAHSIINDYKDRLLAGEVFEEGKFYQDFIEGFDICFAKVSKDFYDEYFGWGQWLYDGDDFDMLQLVWPTTGGQWPWDEDTSEYYDWAQPILNKAQAIEKI